jgi:hypothetical protein
VDLLGGMYGGTSVPALPTGTTDKADDVSAVKKNIDPGNDFCAFSSNFSLDTMARSEEGSMSAPISSVTCLQKTRNISGIRSLRPVTELSPSWKRKPLPVRDAVDKRLLFTCLRVLGGTFVQDINDNDRSCMREGTSEQPPNYPVH